MLQITFLNLYSNGLLNESIVTKFKSESAK